MHAENVVGAQDASGAVVFSHMHAGRVRLEGCSIKNKGVDCSSSDNSEVSSTENGGNGQINGGSELQEMPCFWKRKFPRAESCRIILCGRSEFFARDVVLCGDTLFEVPDGQCMEVRLPICVFFAMA